MAECHDDGNHLLTSSQLSSLIVSHRVSSCLIVADTAWGTLSGKQLNAQPGRRETNAMEKINYACANTWVYNSTRFYNILPRMGECMYKETEAVWIFFWYKMHLCQSDRCLSPRWIWPSMPWMCPLIRPLKLQAGLRQQRTLEEWFWEVLVS